MKYKNHIVFILCMLGFYSLHAGNPIAVKQFINHKDWNFVENKGQLNASDIKYYGHQGGVYLYCRPGIIEFVFTKAEKESEQISEASGQPVETQCLRLTHASAILQSHRPQDAFNASLQRKITTCHANLVLIHSNPNAQIIASDQQEYYENYYTSNTPEEGITNVHTYKTITYKDIYPYIDLILHSREEGLKYEFVVNPGGKVSDIQMKWEGIEGIKKLENSGIEYDLAFGIMTESAPYSYQGMANVWADTRVRPSGKYSVEGRNLEKGRTHGSAPYQRGCEEIESQFVLKKNNIIGFKTAAYDKTKPLVIDPDIVWCTYFAGEIGNGIATDDSENVLITGPTIAPVNVASSGAYQTSYAGYLDAYIAKFSTSGTRLWSTYFGGSGNDAGYGIATDPSENILITGYTNSTNMATSGAYQTSYAGSVYDKGDGDAFIAKFTTAGTIIWSTYYGGNSADAGYGIKVDASGNIYMVGSTDSYSGIATNGAYQSSYAGLPSPNNNGYVWGNAFLVKFSSSGIRQWGTYFGTGGGYGGAGLTIDPSGYVYITGTAGERAYVAKFTFSGSFKWSIFNGYVNFGNSIAIDPSGNVFITGYTVSGDSDVASSGAFETNFYGTYGTFIAKFSTSGNRLWSTFYTAYGDNRGYSIACDKQGNAYITGNTSIISGLATSGAFETYGFSFVAVFSPSGNRVWSSYFGGGQPSDGYGITIDGLGNILLTGETQSGGIATQGAFDSVYYGGLNFEAFVAKITNKYLVDVGIDSIITPSNKICTGTYPVSVYLKNYGYDTVKNVKISWTLNDTLQKTYNWTGILPPDSITYIKLASYNFSPGYNTKLKAWTSKPNGRIDEVPANDTSNIIFNVNPLPKVNTGPAETICEDSVITIGGTAVNGYSYSWTSDPVGFSSTFSKPYIAPMKTTTYHLIITDNTTGCSNSDSVVITVNPAPIVNAGSNATICAGKSVVIGDTEPKNYAYTWISIPYGFSSTITQPTVSPLKNITYYLYATNPKTGCIGFNTVTITVNPLPVPGIDSTHYTICTGTHIAIGIMAQPDIAYSWTSQPAGFASTQSNPIVNPAGNTIYFLTETNTVTGCSSNDSSKVTVTIPKAPVSSPGFNQTICYGNIAVLGADPLAGITYSWTSDPPGFVSTSPKAGVKPDTTTTYYLTVKNSIGCTDLGSVTVKVNPLPVVNAGLPQTVCSGTAVQLGSSAVAGDFYLWTSLPTGFQSNISNPVDSPNITTEYYVKGTIDSTGCGNSDSVKITVVPRPNALFNVKNLNGFEYQFSVLNPNYPSWQYHWSFGDTSSAASTGSATYDTTSGYNVSHTYSQNGTYKVYLTISLPGLCTEIDSYLVVINEQFGLNIFPNPFGLQTDINYTLVNPGHVRISLVDELGQQLGTLLDEQLSQGEYNTYFDATLWHTRPAMYFILFQLDDKLIVKKIIQMGDGY